MKNRVSLTLSNEAIEALLRRASERKRGELVSKLIVEYDRLMATEEAIAELRRRVAELEAKV